MLVILIPYHCGTDEVFVLPVARSTPSNNGPFDGATPIRGRALPNHGVCLVVEWRFSLKTSRKLISIPMMPAVFPLPLILVTIVVMFWIHIRTMNTLVIGTLVMATLILMARFV